MAQLTIYVAGSFKHKHGVRLLGRELRAMGCRMLDWTDKAVPPPGLTPAERRIWMDTDRDGGEVYAFCHHACLTADMVIYYGASGQDAGVEVGLAAGAGVCQDHAHALIAIARERGLPARYVSGYLHVTSDGAAHDAAHAWAEIHVGALGWVGFDAANACCPDDRYVRLGSGYDADDAAPVRGTTYGSGQESLDVRVQVEEMSQDQ